MTKVLIGVDGSDRSEDAVAFGRALALAAGAPVILSTAHPAEPRQPRLDGQPAYAGLREEAETKSSPAAERAIEPAIGSPDSTSNCPGRPPVCSFTRESSSVRCGDCTGPGRE